MFMATLIAGRGRLFIFTFRSGFRYRSRDRSSALHRPRTSHCLASQMLACGAVRPVHPSHLQEKDLRPIFWLRWWLDALERKFEHAATRLHGRNMPANIVTIPSCRFLTNAEKLASFGEAMVECGTQVTVPAESLILSAAQIPRQFFICMLMMQSQGCHFLCFALLCQCSWMAARCSS